MIQTSQQTQHMRANIPFKTPKSFGTIKSRLKQLKPLGEPQTLELMTGQNTKKAKEYTFEEA